MLTLRYGYSLARNVLQRQCLNNVKPVRLKSMCWPKELPKYVKGFNNIPELENANEMVQRIFSLEMASHADVRKVAAEVYSEQFDTALEKNIANSTNHIRILTEWLLRNKKDMKTKQFLIWLIDQRKKMLRKMQKADIDKYNKMIEEFEIPPLQSPFEPHNRYKFRKFKINVPLKKKREIHEFEDAQVY